jgi:hypothetical protein
MPVDYPVSYQSAPTGQVQTPSAPVEYPGEHLAERLAREDMQGLVNYSTFHDRNVERVRQQLLSAHQYYLSNDGLVDDQSRVETFMQDYLQIVKNYFAREVKEINKLQEESIAYGNMADRIARIRLSELVNSLDQSQIIWRHDINEKFVKELADGVESHKNGKDR